MSIDNLVIKKISNPEDVDSAIAFFNVMLSHKMDNAIWQWEFDTFKQNTILTVVKNDSETIGTQFMLPFPVVINGKNTMSGKCENSYFNPIYRGKGLFEKLFQYATEQSLTAQFGLLWAFTPATKVYNQKLGFQVFENVIERSYLNIHFPKIKDSKKYTKNKLKIIVKHGLKVINFISHKIKTNLYLKGKSFNCKIANQVNHFNDFTVLYNELKETHGDFIYLDINEEFFKWRISYNINLNYITHFFYNNNKLMGYYIIAKHNGMANITDFTACNDSIHHQMFIHLYLTVKMENLKAINYFGNKENALNKMNFNKLKKLGASTLIDTGMPFVFKTIGNKTIGNQYQNNSNWYLNGLWTEGFTY